MNRTRKKGRQRPWHLHTRTRWIPIGTVIPVPRTTSRAILIALPCVSNKQYHGGDTVQVGNGAGLQILHLGSCSLNTDARPLALNNVLHVPDISKHLLSVYKLSRDNNVFFEFHPWYYFIKDRATRKLLLEGNCESGLYPLQPSDIESLHHALVGYSARPDQ